MAKVHPETVQWIAAVGAVILGVVFFAMSFKIDSEEVVYDETSELSQQLRAQQPPPAKPFKPRDIPRKMETYQQALKEARETPTSQSEKMDRSRLPKEVAKKIIPRKVKKVPSPSPKVPLKEKVTQKPKPETRVARKKPVQVAKAKPQPKPQPKPAPVKVVKAPAKPAPPVSQRKVAGNKKKKLAQQIAHMKSTKKKPRKSTPKKKVVKKKVIKTSSVPRVAAAAGGKKSISFYRQRDRLALFYSSLRAETLSVDIAREYKKLRKNKRAWASFYGKWRGKVRRSLSKDIQQFPKRNEKYAYPKVLASFKKDYNLIYKYGESFNAKVKGARAPSGVPSNMLAVFSRYKKQAQVMGR